MVGGIHAELVNRVVAGFGKRLLNEEPGVGDFIRVAGFIICRCVRSEAEKSDGERFGVSAAAAEKTAFFKSDAAALYFTVVEPALPHHGIALLAFGGVLKKDAGKFPPALLPEIDVGKGDAAAGAHILFVKHDRGDKTADKQSFDNDFPA